MSKQQPQEVALPKTKSLELHTALADRILMYLRDYEAFKDPTNGVMPIPGFSKGVMQEMLGHCIVVGATPKADKVTIQVGLTMSGKESETFTNVRFHPLSGSYLYTRKSLEINIDDTMGRSMDQVLSSLFPILEEGKKMMRSPSPESMYHSGDFPLVMAQSLKTRNKIMRIGGTIGGTALAITTLFTMAGIALGPEHLNEILQQIPDEYLSEWLIMAKKSMLDFAEGMQNGGLEMILSRRYTGFVLTLEGMKIALIAGPIGVAIAEQLRKKPKYIDDL